MKTGTRAISFVLLLTSLLIVGRSAELLAQSGPSVGLSVIGSGGRSAVGSGDISMNGTLGQPIVASIDGGSISVQAGYWYVVNPHERMHVYLPILLRVY